jgi:hypothetical protein
MVIDDDAGERATAMAALDPDRLDAFVRTIASTIDGALHAVTVLVGDRLGLYRAMADGEPIDDRELATRTGTSVEFVAVWLVSQAAAGYVSPGPAAGTYYLPREHAAVLVNEGEGVSVAGGLRVAAAAFKDEPQVTEAFRTGVPPAPRDRHPDLAAGLARWHRAAATGRSTGSPARTPVLATAPTLATLFIDAGVAAGEQGGTA